mgnify:CR=1 FL=1
MKKLDLNSITISLIIPTLNAAEYMPGLIDILGRQTRKPDEIIVIDSESEDATVRMAEQAGFRTLKVKKSETGKPAGASATATELCPGVDPG